MRRNWRQVGGQNGLGDVGKLKEGRIEYGQNGKNRGKIFIRNIKILR